MTIVHGPIAEKVGMNCGSDALGPGNRANASIGRAMRLILINIGGGIPGVTDKATHGQGAKFSFCTAECGPGNPWPPLHVDKGFDAGASAVTIFPTTGPEEVGPGGKITDPKEILSYAANTMTRWGTLVMRDAPGHVLVLLALGHVQLSFAPNGWTKRDIQEYLFEHERIDAGTVPDKMLRYRAKSGKDPGLFDGKLSPVRSSEDIYVVVAGGHEAHHIMVLPGAPAYEPVTELITDEVGVD